MDGTDNFAFLLPVMLLIFGAACVAASRWGSRAALFWGVGFITAALAFSVPLIPLPPVAQSLIANTLFLVAFLAYGQGLLLRFDRPTRLGARIAVAVIFLAAIAYAVVVRGDLQAELMLSDCAVTLLLAWPLLLVIRHIRQPVDGLLVGVMTLMALESGIRVFAISWLITLGSGPEAYFDSGYAWLSQSSAGVIATLFALSALATVAADIVQRHRRDAETDALTGLANRRGFDRLVLATPLLAQQGALVQCDIDHFKRVNDSFGHAAGDLVLVRLAAILTSHLPRGGLAARFGGEEFVVLLPGHTLAEAGDFAHVIRLALAASNWQDAGIAGPITASFGVARPALSDHSIHDAVARADQALYAAKAAGRNQVVLEARQFAVPADLKIVG